jgi:hypothetical protein
VIADHLCREVNASSMRFVASDDALELLSQMRNRIDEYEMSIAILLSPLLKIHGVDVGTHYWFTADQLRFGYILLHKSNAFEPTHVLFLRDHTDWFSGDVTHEGDIELFKHVYHFLERLNATIPCKKVKTKNQKKYEENT